MPHPDHDAIIDAFLRVDPACTAGCHRGNPGNGYTHIHGPHQAIGNHHCTQHGVTVEKTNGTVSLRDPIAQQLGGTPRVAVPIAQDPMGYAVRPNFGHFGRGFTSGKILQGWRTFDDFARDVIAAFRAGPGW